METGCFLCKPFYFPKTAIFFLMTAFISSSSLAYEEPLKVGVYYFGGWQSEPNYHLEKPNSLLLTPAFKNRMPLSGWYDDQPKVMDKEIEWAVRDGIDFFAFLWYWPEALSQEEGRLNYPLDCFLRSTVKGRKYLKFCVVYTNHGPFDIAPRDDWDRYTRLWIKWMSRRDYFRVAAQKGEQAKPLFIIFSPQRFHDHWKAVPEGARGALNSLREMAAKRGLPGIVIGGCWDPSSKEIFEEDGYDIVTGYNFAWLGNTQAREPGTYDSLAKGHLSIWDSMATLGKPIIPLITSGWDPRPWPGTAMVSPYYPDRTPQRFNNFCRSAKGWIDSHEGDVVVPKSVLIYAWNELGEGGYILPTIGEGYGYLEAIKGVFGKHISSRK